MARLTAELLSGCLVVKSGIGRGSTFTFSLPNCVADLGPKRYHDVARPLEGNMLEFEGGESAGRNRAISSGSDVSAEFSCCNGDNRGIGAGNFLSVGD